MTNQAILRTIESDPTVLRYSVEAGKVTVFYRNGTFTVYSLDAQAWDYKAHAK